MKPIKDAFGSARRMLRASRPDLGTVCLVRNNDNIVALTVWLLRVDILVELVDQAEEVTVVFFQLSSPRSSPEAARGVWSIGDATADKGLVDLAVEVISVGH